MLSSLKPLDGVPTARTAAATDQGPHDFAARLRRAPGGGRIVESRPNPLFDTLRRRIGDPQAYERVVQKLKNYEKYFKAGGPVQRHLVTRYPGDVVRAIESMRIYSNMPAHKARRMAFTRRLTTMDDDTYTPEVNQAVLGNAQCLARTNAECVLPGNQVSLEMRSPFMRDDGKVVRPVILSVSAPDLGSPDQPEWPHYVNSDNRLREAPYRYSLETLWGHIFRSSAQHPDHRVVLSAFGMENFIKGLPPKEKGRARAIGADVFARSIKELQHRGIDVAFSDIEENGPFWTDVNRLLPEGSAIRWVGALPGRWMRNKDITVNSWDPIALVGNGCRIDNSFDGWLGRSSATSESHVLVCILYYEGVLGEVANIPVQH
jgi:hypothetical protein